MSHVIEFILIGLAAGWLAGRIMKHRPLDLVGNLVLGVIGSLIGGLAFGALQIAPYSLLGELVCATLGSMALIWLVRYFNRK